MKILMFFAMWLLVEIAFKVSKQNFNQRRDTRSQVLDDWEFLKS